jgi:hypothetical protein
MKPIQRTSASIVTPGEVRSEISRYNSLGWIVISAWWTDEKMKEICLNAIYRGGKVYAEMQDAVTIEKVRKFRG